MIGISDIYSYIPEGRESNYELMDKFDISEDYLRDKLGVFRRAVMGKGEGCVEMASKALYGLAEKTGVDPTEIDVIIVVTQSSTEKIPPVSALVHANMKLSDKCAAFDVGLGCSGYVYGLSILESFVASNDLNCGVIITCDPYSRIVDRNDKATALLFGDAATATMVNRSPLLVSRKFLFGTRGDKDGALACNNDVLSMNGRLVFNFANTLVPSQIDKLLTEAGIKPYQVDSYIFHQGSKYIVDAITKRLRISKEKVKGGIEDIGNTISSSIPILLEKDLFNIDVRTIVLSGFGVGLSWASCIYQRRGV